jgi:nifR3 family TIM-barrel protein
MSFWSHIEKPIIALSPMDGVTDASFRFMTVKYGRPDVLITEFTSVEAICFSPKVLLEDLVYNEAERPIVAQVYGYTPEAFYKVAHIVCELGFDGLDINMGCPAKNVASKGCGAALILNPPLARSIIRATQQGVRDWVSGQSLWDLQLNPQLIEKVMRMNRERGGEESSRARAEIPVSVKTRLGYDRVVIEGWVETLLEERPAAISIHGRTLKQMYQGSADWGAISRAVKVARNTGTLILGNGDLESMNDVVLRVRESGVDGVLLGRSTLGNPWIFRNKERVKHTLGTNYAGPIEEVSVSMEERLQVLLEHTRHFEGLRGVSRFVGIRKHLGWYCKGFYKASDLRVKMLQAGSTRDVEAILNTYTTGRAWIPSLAGPDPSYPDPSIRGVCGVVTSASHPHVR